MVKDVRRERKAAKELHPAVYVALVGFALWFAMAVWGFAADEYTAYLLFVVTGFVAMVVGIPLVLWLVSRRHHAPNAPSEDNGSFRSWASGDFDTGQDRVKGANAAVEALLPIGMAAFGMTAFAIVLHLAAPGVFS